MLRFVKRRLSCDVPSDIQQATALKRSHGRAGRVCAWAKGRGWRAHCFRQAS